jgi:hypothetical protein
MWLRWADTVEQSSLARHQSMWRRDPDPAGDVLRELAELREEVQALRSRIRAARRTERRIAERRTQARPFGTDRRRHHA